MAPRFGLAVVVLLAGCAARPSSVDAPAAMAAAPVAARWHAPLPQAGSAVQAGDAWVALDDALLLRLVEAAQHVSPTLAQASARIADARAAHTADAAALVLDASASTYRALEGPGAPIGSAGLAGVKATWDLDLFGARRAGADAAQARLSAREAARQEARVALAAEVAGTYVALRACEAQLEQAELDAASRAQTAKLAARAAEAGLRPPAAADLALASAAQGGAILQQRRTQCDLLVKSLVALTACDETALRRELDDATARLPVPGALSVAVVPAEVLARRPDIAAAARELIAAAADADQAEAQRWPSIALSGSIYAARLSSARMHTSGNVWSIGPIEVTLPLFDGGARRANAQAALARYEAAKVAYAGSLRTAVREVESALVALHGALARGDDARRAAEGFERSYEATAARWRGGLASLFELEDARRSMVGARVALIEQRRESVAAWIETCRATGGGWAPRRTEAAPAPAPARET